MPTEAEGIHNPTAKNCLTRPIDCSVLISGTNLRWRKRGQSSLRERSKEAKLWQDRRSFCGRWPSVPAKSESIFATCQLGSAARCAARLHLMRYGSKTMLVREYYEECVATLHLLLHVLSHTSEVETHSVPKFVCRYALTCYCLVSLCGCRMLVLLGMIYGGCRACHTDDPANVEALHNTT